VRYRRKTFTFAISSPAWVLVWDADYCYRRSSVVSLRVCVCVSVSLSVCLLITFVFPEKWMNRSRCRLGKGRHGVFVGKTVWSMPERFEIYIVYKWRYTNTLPFLSSPVTLAGPRNHVLDWVKVGRIHSQPRGVTGRRCGLSSKLFDHLLCLLSK